MSPDFGIQSIRCKYPDQTFITEICHKELILAVTKQNVMTSKINHHIQVDEALFREKFSQCCNFKMRKG